MAVGRKTRLRVLRGHEVPPQERGRAVLPMLLRVFGRWSEEAARVVKPFGLTVPHFDVLMCLNLGEGISQQDLSERLLLTKGNISITVQKMESAGLIERRTDPADQRFHRLYLTDAGRCLIARVIPRHIALAGRVLKGMSVAEQKTLYELLCRLDQGFDDLDMAD